MLVYFETKRMSSLKTKKKKILVYLNESKKMTCGAYPRKYVLDETRMGELVPVDKNQISQIQYVSIRVL